MTNGSYVSIKTGSEGPRHDPYAYTEITVHRADGREVVLHTGLAEWMTYKDGRVVRRFQDEYKILRSKFEAIVGITPECAEKIPRIMQQRRFRQHEKTCGSRDVADVDGYPGESMLYCNKCNTVLDYHFDISAVE
jgi:hypothetical protein